MRIIILVVLAIQVVAIETGYMYQMEYKSLFSFFKQDIKNITKFLNTRKFTIFSHNKCHFREFNVNLLEMNYNNVQLTLFGDKLQFTFYLNQGIRCEIFSLWEYDWLILPITGTGMFYVYGKDLTYTVKLSQPFDGDLFVPELSVKWHLERAELKSVLGELGVSLDEVKQSFVEVLNKNVMQYLNNYLKTVISNRYKEYYTFKVDKIEFPSISNSSIEILRKPKQLIVSSHFVAVEYHEISIKPDELSKEIKVVGDGNANSISTGDGILRRYVRDTIIFEKITEGLLRILKDHRIRDKDLPKSQKIRLDSTTIQVMIPGFKSFYGDNAEIYVDVSGEESLSHPQISSLRPQLIDLHEVTLKFTFYVNDEGIDENFLTTIMTFDMVLKPILTWNKELPKNETTLSLNFGLESINGKIQDVKSVLFKKDIIKDGINSHICKGILEFIRGKCPENLMGSGLKVRDELGPNESVKAMMDISGKTINIWIYQTNSL